MKIFHRLRNFLHHISHFNQYSLDDPEWDQTDFAHPSWWRGCNFGTLMTADIVNSWLDGEKWDGCYGNEALNKLRSRIIAILQERNLNK